MQEQIPGGTQSLKCCPHLGINSGVRGLSGLFTVFSPEPTGSSVSATLRCVSSEVLAHVWWWDNQSLESSFVGWHLCFAACSTRKAEGTALVNIGVQHGLVKGNFTKCPRPLLFWQNESGAGGGGSP